MTQTKARINSNKFFEGKNLYCINQWANLHSNFALPSFPSPSTIKGRSRMLIFLGIAPFIGQQIISSTSMMLSHTVYFPLCFLLFHLHWSKGGAGRTVRVIAMRKAQFIQKEPTASHIVYLFTPVRSEEFTGKDITHLAKVRDGKILASKAHCILHRANGDGWKRRRRRDAVSEKLPKH